MGTERCLYERGKFDGDGQACLLPPSVVVGAGVAVQTPTIDMQGYDRACFHILGGATGTALSTLDAEVLQCTEPDDAGGDAKPLAGLRGPKAIKQVEAGDDYMDRNDKWLIEVRAEEMDVNNGFRYLLVEYEVLDQDMWMLAIESERSKAGYEAVTHTYITEIVD